MKIVYCLIDSSPSGGMERIVCAKANYLADHMGYDITIITTDREGKANFFDFSPRIRFIDLDINYRYLHGKNFVRRLLEQLRKRRLHKKRLEDILKELKPDICISTYTHEFTILPKMSDRSKRVAEIHFCKHYKEIEYSLLNASFLRKQKALWAEKNKSRYVNRYEAFVVLTEDDAAKWSKFKNVRVIPNVLPFVSERISLRQERRVISLGRLTPQKGFSRLIDIWKIVVSKCPDWHLDIYGTGEEYQVLSEKIISRQLSNGITIHSPEEDVESIYTQASVYAMSSVYEGFGLVLAEAMSCGLPCVAFDCPSGPSEIISDGEDGYLVPDGDINLFADRLIRLIDDEALRNRMGEKACENSKRFLPENIMPRWVELFEDVKNNRRNG
ncbi:glycosyltransferase family 4 protein [Dysgonomonas macrotermitis]|uniref:Glycosyltransferase involved in cell wall bisynthesis n=1 Tax=Dysgonomonas macrotermitis TaxID=1346286 RepID=A0A1M5FSL5_9BACT|nr:glycosyltransferase family 4 protein [Dysgonomonas macrotermitis]SHF94537.1 Glycosyltransferase involved in cell wall bisynthesis [Dysgonomonas macrotermitis]